MKDILHGSATQQAKWIREGKISSVELVQAHLDQISRVNPELNAVVALYAEAALRQARAADEAVAAGAAAGPFHGVPFTIKDSIELEGTLCTAGTWGRRAAVTGRRHFGQADAAGRRHSARQNQSPGPVIRL